MHEGVREWLRLLFSLGASELVEFDVEDCFLNTPREAVLPALDYWLQHAVRRRRGPLYFSISKDHQREDHLGRPCSSHFWEVSSSALQAVIRWELHHNAAFEVMNETGQLVVLEQHRGLPIGGHLSAALVELVALHRECTRPWPTSLGTMSTMRYRDNFFAAVVTSGACPMDLTAQELADLLAMPVKGVGRGSQARCLEVHLRLGGSVPSCVLAFRTDSDRQVESGSCGLGRRLTTRGRP